MCYMLFFLSGISVRGLGEERSKADFAMYESIEESHEEDQLIAQNEFLETLKPLEESNFPYSYFGWYNDDHLSDIPLPPPKCWSSCQV